MDKTSTPTSDGNTSRNKSIGVASKPEIKPLEVRPITPPPLKTAAPASSPVKTAPSPMAAAAKPAAQPAAKPAPASAAGTAKSAPSTGKHDAKFELYQCNARSVFLAGSFNAWNPQSTPMKNNGSGKWEAAVNLSPGKYEYRFVVDGKWIDDPLAKESAPNPYGGINAIVVVK
jgi:hypothetical protein